jgi:hypothetical protein
MVAISAVFLQNSVFTTIILPFLLIFFIIFAILQKTKVLGSDKSSLDAFVSFVIGLIVVMAFNYSTVINNLVLFLSLSLVVVFVILVLWGFLSGEEGFKLSEHKSFRTILLIIVIIAVILGIFWAFGIPLSGGTNSVTNFLFGQVWSEPFWTNLIFVLLIGAALAIVLGMGRSKSH